MPVTRRILSEKQTAALLAALIALMPLSIDAYLPAIPQLADYLQADIHLIEKSLSSFMFGVAAGQLMGGSISDVKGRRGVALTGLAVFVLSSLGLTLLQNVEQLLALRWIQALGAGMAVVMVGAVVRDHYEGRQAAQMFALIGIILMMAPLVAPMLGSMLQSIGGWRTIFGALTFYGALILALVYLFLPASGGSGGKIDRHFMSGVFKRYYHVLQTHRALGFLFLQAFSFGPMFCFLTESPFVYMKLYELNPTDYAWVFACNILTMAAFNRITAWRLKTGSNAEDILKWGVGLQLAANVLMVLLVLSFGLPPMWLLVLAVMLSVGTQGLISANTQACFMAHFRSDGGSANALLMSGSSLIAALMGWLTTMLHDGTVNVMAGMMLLSSLLGVSLLWGFSRKELLPKR